MATSKKNNTGKVSSPASTGGAGPFFEQHVDAYWLAQLLVGAIPPIFRDSTIIEVALQNEHLGWQTDDLLVACRSQSGDMRRLLGQIKRKVSIGTSDKDFVTTVTDAWHDFKAKDFDEQRDRFVLITLRGSNTLLEHFSALLDSARVARDADEFEERIGVPGLLSKTAKSYLNVVNEVIATALGSQANRDDVWRFIRLLHVLPLDLNTDTGQTEAAVKTMLAHSAGGPDSIAVAEDTWNSLLQIVGAGAPAARQYRRDDLPVELQNRHSLTGSKERAVLDALGQHSEFVIQRITTTIGTDFHLDRRHVVQTLIRQLELNQVVLVTGAAGHGKSAIAMDAIDILQSEHFVFGFRAEEFAHPHLDAALQINQIDVSAFQLGAILAAQERKVLLVESIERLLEKDVRDAFADLLALVAGDTTWQLILTCRDYSADLVRACFLTSAQIEHSVVTVPPLSDEELQQVVAAFPSLKRPIQNEHLRELLRSPYVLDKAQQISWTEDRELPESEYEFRSLFWNEIIRADHHAQPGLPRRREETFAAIALRRARALRSFASCEGLAAEVVDALRSDSLIACPEGNRGLAAPAHDVLEDWAILRWIDEQHLATGGSIHTLAERIDSHPAVRRTYRKWLAELVVRTAADADTFFNAAFADQSLPAHFRDDTLVSLLRSEGSASFLLRHTSQLLANDKQILRRVIHLLRVACVTAPFWLPNTTAHATLLNVPEGPSWACVMNLVADNLDMFRSDDRLLLLGLIEDWTKGVTFLTPYPDGATACAKVAHSVLSKISDYRSDDELERTFKVIAQIPGGDPQGFESLLRVTGPDASRHRVRTFRQLIFESLQGMPAGRDVPDVVAAIGKEYLLLTDSDLSDRWQSFGSTDLEPLFGIRPSRSFGSFPASAGRGPYLGLLRHHPAVGIAFVLDIFNHSVEWYAHPRVSSGYVEPPLEVELTFANGSTRKQWCNGRLWNLHRGTSVGPYVLQSLLMAVERWLLEFAEVRPDDLDNMLLRLIRDSDSAAVTAVVASAATAHPHQSAETLLVLARCPWAIELDRQRLIHESQAPSGLAEHFPSLHSENKPYESERKESDALAHRKRDLETAIANLQLGPLASRVHEILDSHRAAMPAPEDQDDEDRRWRLALHRMDLREYSISEVQEAPAAEDDSNDSEADNEERRRLIRLDLNEPDSDIQDMVAESSAESDAMNSRLGLLMWGMKVFKNEDIGTYSPDAWRDALRDAQAAPDCGEDSERMTNGGPGYVAAVCVRDHWDEMSDTEKEWCATRVASEIAVTACNWGDMAGVQRYEMSADRPCAFVVPLLLREQLSEHQRDTVRGALILGLVHPVDEVRWFCVSGIGRNLWGIDSELALRCANAIAVHAKEVEIAIQTERERLAAEENFDELHGGQWRHNVEQTVAVRIAEMFEEDAIPNTAVSEFEPNGWFVVEAWPRLLEVLRHSPNEPIAIQAFERLAATLPDWWDEDADHRNDRQRSNYQTEGALTDLLEEFLIRTPLEAATRTLAPILDAVDRHPRETSSILRGLIFAEDRTQNTTQFWQLWNLFADRIRNAVSTVWLASIDREHSQGSEMMGTVFLGTWWKDDVQHWRSLEGHAHNIHSLFEALPASSRVMEDYVQFLYHIGEQSLPQSFVTISNKLVTTDTGQALSRSNTVFMLDVLLQRYVYSRPLELKRNEDLRRAILQLLDCLVEVGSSAAFRMRDDFVTPTSTVVE